MKSKKRKYKVKSKKRKYKVKSKKLKLKVKVKMTIINEKKKVLETSGTEEYTNKENKGPYRNNLANMRGTA